MEIAGMMDRTFPTDRIPTRGVGRAKKLGVQADSNHGLFRPHPHDSGCGLPGRTAGGTPKDLDTGDQPL
jgi:hypothetical protein